MISMLASIPFRSLFIVPGLQAERVVDANGSKALLKKKQPGRGVAKTVMGLQCPVEPFQPPPLCEPKRR